MRQGSRLEGELYLPCRHSRVKKSEKEGRRGLGDKGRGWEGISTVALELEQVRASSGGSFPWS